MSPRRFAVIALAERLACKPAVALANVKRAVQRGFSVPLSEALKVEAACYLEAPPGMPARV